MSKNDLSWYLRGAVIYVFIKIENKRKLKFKYKTQGNIISSTPTLSPLTPGKPVVPGAPFIPKSPLSPWSPMGPGIPEQKQKFIQLNKKRIT